ncbi:MAG: DUF4230 domain-containing protein [Anaerolineales bacterium]|nr:DUF4230 domain-containing protein [Anaerolineales bacterium]MCW5854760.1 DUF4230 domain-containing protein [Anaerolineales bacterium]
MQRIRPWLPTIIAVLALMAAVIPLLLVYNLYNSVTDMASSGVQQVSQMAGAMSTQVAQVLHPTPTILPDPVSIIHKVRSLARLETIQYSVEKVITAESRQGALSFLVGDKLLFVAHGTVIAGVDLQKLQPEDIRIEEGILYVNLPEAEIFIASLNNEDSYIYDRQLGFLTRGDVNLETSTRRVAEEEILNAALEDGILEQAQVNAESYLLRLLLSLGFQEVIFE